MSIYRWLADGVVVVHATYVMFVVCGLLAILAGAWCGWGWVRNIWFRGVHLIMIGVVVAESVARITCPLTTLEDALRRRAGETVAGGSFIGRWAHRLIFVDAPPWVFVAAYCLFGLVVLIAFVWVPPRWPGRRSSAKGDSPESPAR